MFAENFHLVLFMTMCVTKCSLPKYSRQKWLLSVPLLLIMAAILTPVFAESETDYKKRPLDVRVDRLERLTSSQKQLELLYRMKQLQEENQQLRSLLEEQTNEMHLIKQQQRELYTDLNRRLSQMEGADPGKMATTVKPEDKYSATGTAEPVLSPAKYGTTEREEVSVSDGKIVEQPVDEKKAVYKKIPMSKKERLQEQKAYQKAYDELRARRYSKARDSFVAFIQKYPGGSYAHIAQYWVAESSYAQQNYEQAIIDYQLLLDFYPMSPKKAEAELKKANSFYELGNKETARQTLNQLLINYPETTEAGQAKRLLKQL